MLVQLIYVSVPTVDSYKATSEFVPVAQFMNAKNDITGLILSSPEFYLQVLEGDRISVNRLYQNILKDTRHENPTLLRYTEIKEREFSDWSMTHTTCEELSSSYIQPVVMPSKIAPKGISGVQALTLLRRVYLLLHSDSLAQVFPKVLEPVKKEPQTT